MSELEASPEYRKYDPYILTYHGEVYKLTPENTGIIIIEDEPEYSYVCQVNNETHELISPPIFNDYLIAWLRGELKDRYQLTIDRYLGWKLEPPNNVSFQPTADNTDRRLKHEHDTWDLRTNVGIPEGFI